MRWQGLVGARWLSADGELAGCGHGGFRKSLIIRWSFSMGVETWIFLTAFHGAFYN